jgi:regulator of sirC expression with transglutaminase-like and TPR domain
MNISAKSKKRNLRKAVCSLMCFSMNKIGKLLFIFAIFSISVFSQTRSPILYYHGQTIWQLPKIAEKDIDIGLWALIIAKEFDPSIDIPKYSSKLDSCVLEIRKMLADRTLDRDKTNAVKMFIYEPGVWNNFHPFTYDLDDPLGEKITNRLISTYLDTRKGNCVSMPTLFYALLQRLDPKYPICGVESPRHYFCRIKDRQTKDSYNFEATHGGAVNNLFYIVKNDLSQKSIDSGLYLRDLTKKEYLGSLIQILVHKYRDKNEFQTAIKYNELALELSPKSAVPIIGKCALNAELACRLYEKRAREGKLSEKETELYNKYSAISREYGDKAFSRGWREWTQEDTKKYLETVKNEKEKRAQ